MQEKFNFIYDAQNHPGNVDLILQGIDKEAADLYRDWRYTLYRDYRSNVCIDGVVRATQQKPRSLQTMDQWQLTCDLFESESYRVSEILIHNIFFSFHIFYTKNYFR